MPATEVLGVNQTLAVCRGCRQASRRVRQALPEFRNAVGAGGASASVDGGRSSMTVHDDTGSNHPPLSRLPARSAVHDDTGSNLHGHHLHLKRPFRPVSGAPKCNRCGTASTVATP